MEENKLVEQFKNNTATENTYKEALKWCIENEEKMALSNENQRILYNAATEFLMKVKLGKWNEEEVHMLVCFSASKYALHLGILDKIHFEILDDTSYSEKFGKSLATCTYISHDTSHVFYSEKLINHMIKSTNSYDLLSDFSVIFHEIFHALQNISIHKAVKKGENMEYYGNRYKIVLEKIVRIFHPEFYKENYLYLFNETQAHYCGLDYALEIFKEYNPKIYISFDIDILKHSFKTLNDHAYSIKTANFNDFNVNFASLVDYISTQSIQRNPKIIEQYPVLEFAYNSDGTKKSLIQLIEERKTLIKNNPNLSLDIINDIYESIANFRHLEENEVSTLSEYIKKTKSSDKFLFDLLKFRLDKTNMNDEEKELFLLQLKQNIK